MSKHDDAYNRDRKAHDKERVDKFLGRKSGGRVEKDGETNIHIEINAKDDQEATDAPSLPGPIPPMPPPMAGPPPGGPPMMPPGAPGPIGGLKTGGSVKSTDDIDAGAMSGEGRLEKTDLQRRKR